MKPDDFRLWALALAKLAGVPPVEALNMRVVDLVARIRRRMAQ